VSWFKCDPTDFWNQHEVQALTIEGVGFLWWLCGRSWTTGPIRDDPAFYRRQAFSRVRDFDASWKEVRSVLEVRDGHLVFPWFDTLRAETQAALEKDKARKALARAVRPTDSTGVPRIPKESDGFHRRREEMRGDEKRQENHTSSPSARPRRVVSGDHAILTQRFTDLFESKTGAKYKFSGGKDGKAVKELIAHFGGLDPAWAYVERWTKTPPDWIKGPVDLTFLNSQVNRLQPVKEHSSFNRIGSADNLPEL
jgi:hypothetical protein